jgi:hypothetical protein
VRLKTLSRKDGSLTSDDTYKKLVADNKNKKSLIMQIVFVVMILAGLGQLGRSDETGCELVKGRLVCDSVEAMMESRLPSVRFLELTGDVLDWDVISRRFTNLLVRLKDDISAECSIIGVKI